MIIPEPFAQRIPTAQLGVMWVKLIVRGKPVHVLNTGAGINAIQAAYEMYNSLTALEEHWNEVHGFFPLGTCTDSS